MLVLVSKAHEGSIIGNIFRCESCETVAPLDRGACRHCGETTIKEESMSDQATTAPEGETAVPELPVDTKYIVFKREDFLRVMQEITPGPHTIRAVADEALVDAVVIRRQDVFAPPALDSYANSIITAIGIVEETIGGANGLTGRLQGVADYFHNQAVASYHTNRKLPD